MQNITTHTENNITIITINRESKMNALTIDTLKEIKEGRKDRPFFQCPKGKPTR